MSMRFGRLSVAMLMAGLMVGTASMMARADDAPGTAPAAATGTISGQVVDKDGKGVADAHVMAFVKAPKTDKQGASKQDDTPAPKKSRPKPTATAMTDDSGNFTLKDVPVGDYTVRAYMKGAGSGKAGETVTVKVGEDTKLTSPITLEPAKVKS